MQTIELADGGILLYDDAFLPVDLAGRYFAEPRDTAPWGQKRAAFGHLQPRLTASNGDDGVTYYYSGTENRPSCGRRLCWRSSGRSRPSGAGSTTAC